MPVRCRPGAPPVPAFDFVFLHFLCVVTFWFVPNHARAATKMTRRHHSPSQFTASSRQSRFSESAGFSSPRSDYSFLLFYSFALRTNPKAPLSVQSVGQEISPITSIITRISRITCAKRAKVMTALMCFNLGCNSYHNHIGLWGWDGKLIGPVDMACVLLWGSRAALVGLVGACGLGLSCVEN